LAHPELCLIATWAGGGARRARDCLACHNPHSPADFLLTHERTGATYVDLPAAVDLCLPGLTGGGTGFTVHSTKRTLSVSAENRWAVQEQTARDGEYRESLELDFTGSIYHPNLLSYTLHTR
jgi:hypothetical protein